MSFDAIKFKLASIFGGPEAEFEKRVGGSARKLAYFIKSMDFYYLPKWIEALGIRSLLEKGTTLDEVVNCLGAKVITPLKALFIALEVNKLTYYKDGKYYLSSKFDKLRKELFEVPEVLEEIKKVLDLVTENAKLFFTQGMPEDLKILYYMYLQRCSLGRALRSWIFKRLNIRRFNKIIDIGCGAGYTIFDILSIHPDIEYILGIDIIETPVNIARKILDTQYKWARNKVQFIVSTVDDLITDFRNYFDAAILFFTLHRVEDMEKLLRDIKMLLKKNASLIVVNPVRGGGSLKLMPCSLNILMTIMGARIPPTLDELEAIIRGCGFKLSRSLKLVLYFAEWVKSD